MGDSFRGHSSSSGIRSLSMDEVEPDQPRVDPDTTNLDSPLVFVSHDTRDADLAEAFCKLLSSVSAGMLKSFRSSDKKGSQGFEYGVEWYPELMKKLDSATDVVCLLTPRSVDRPWILYEAGVAKGKIDSLVHGLALGIPLSRASSGPFAQFQNCDDEVDSISKLVVQLVKRLPSADPDPEMINVQVASFRDRASEILAAQAQEGDVIEDAPDNASKLFEEIKVIFNELPGRVESAAARVGNQPRNLMHKDPGIVEEVLMMGRMSGDASAMLVAFSAFRDDFPWVYDLALEVYRNVRDGNRDAAAKSWRDLEQSVMAVSHGPWRRMGRKMDTMFLEVADEWVHRFRPEILFEEG